MAELKNIRIAISGIYDYAFEELGNLGLSFSNAPDFTEKKAIYKVYRPATVLASAVDKFKMLPLTHHHPRNPVDEKNFRELTIGFTDSNPFVDYLEDKNEVGIRSTALLYDSEALDAYERGEIQLSPGYFADFEWQNGVSPNGEKYDIIMKEIKDVNHLALLPNGRGGNDAVVLDSRKTIFDIVREQMQKDGAPKGNDNASKEHKKERKGALKVLTKSELHNFIKTHKNSKENIRVSLGDVKEEAKQRIKAKTGIEVNRVILESDSIRHAFKKPNHNLEEDDLDDMFDVINTTTDISLSEEKSNNNQVIIFKKQEPNGVYLLEEFRSGKGDLELVTAYRLKKNRQPQHNVNKINPGNNVQNGTAPSDNLSQDSLPRKTIFEIVQMNIFDQIRYKAI